MSVTTGVSLCAGRCLIHVEVDIMETTYREGYKGYRGYLNQAPRWDSNDLRNLRRLGHVR